MKSEIANIADQQLLDAVQEIKEEVKASEPVLRHVVSVVSISQKNPVFEASSNSCKKAVAILNGPTIYIEHIVNVQCIQNKVFH